MPAATLKLVCRICREAGEGAQTYEFKLAMYDREMGWLLELKRIFNPSFGPDLQAWFNRHKHDSPRGDEILMVREEP